MSMQGSVSTFVGLVFVMLIAYVLHRGVFVGADVELRMFGGPPWPNHCKYLHWRGLCQQSAKASGDREKTEATYCPYLRN